MRQSPRLPILLATVLCVAALLVLWLRPAGTREAPGTATVTGRASASTGTSAVDTRVPSRPTPLLETPATLAAGSFVVRVVASGAPVAGAQVRAYLRGPDDGTGERVLTVRLHRRR